MCLPVGEGERGWGKQSHCELLPITHLYSGEAAAGDCGLPGPVGWVPAAAGQTRYLTAAQTRLLTHPFPPSQRQASP